MDNQEYVIVTRHAGLVEWLKLKGIVGPVMAQATLSDVTGKVVVGVLPPHLSCVASLMITVDMPGLTPEQRGKDLTPAEMDAAGATLTAYQIKKVNLDLIGQLKLVDGWTVEAYLNGIDGYAWLSVGNLESAVYDCHGNHLGLVEEFQFRELYADEITGRILRSTLP